MKCLGESSKVYHCKVLLLDGREWSDDVKADATGEKLLDFVFRYLHVTESTYFGLRYLDASNQTHWLDPVKKLCRQMKGSSSFTFYFGVKFYVPDPCKLTEEVTRYQFVLQVKQDILQGRLPVPFDVATELAAFAIQSDLGDYDPRRHTTGYVSEFHLIPGQTVEMENRIAEHHKVLIGQVPAVAEMNYLDRAKWLEMYGMDLHPVLGEDNIEYFVGLTPNGVVVLRNKTKVGNYLWTRITKIYFKGRYFMLRVRDKSNEDSTYGFELPTKQSCKHLWKCCVEHHTFFSEQSRHQPSRRVNSSFSSLPQLQRTPLQRSKRRLPPTDGIDNTLQYEPPKNQPNEESRSAAASLGSANNILSSSVPAVLPLSDSPRSTRSAPLGGKQRGLYSSSTNPSPRSVRSSSNKHSLRMRNMRPSSSVDSESSCDGRSHRHRHRTSGHSSDGSKASRRSRSKAAQKKSRSRERGTESECLRKRHRRRPLSALNSDLIDVDPQWCRIEQQHTVQLQSAVIKQLGSHRSGYMNSGMESESEINYQPKKHRRHNRAQSRSPSDHQRRFPDELRRHFKYIDAPGISHEELKQIPYTRVEINNSQSRRSLNSLKSGKGISGDSSVRSAKSSTSAFTVQDARSGSSSIARKWNTDGSSVTPKKEHHEMSTEL